MMTALTLSGCGSDVESGGVLTALSCSGSDVPNAGNTACEAPPPPVCALPLVVDVASNSCVLPPDPNAPEPSIFAGEDQAILFYNRPQDASNSANDPVYEGWKLHTWSDEACDAYADGDTDWPSGRVHDGVDPDYGAYWILALKPGYAGTAGACANFIIHKGTSGDGGTEDGKEMQGGDFKMSLDQTGQYARMNWTFSGVATVFENAVASLGVSIGDASAHWIDAQTLVWSYDPGLTEVSTAQLFYSAADGLKIEGGTIVNGQSHELTATTLTEEQIAQYPEVAGLHAFTGNWTAEQAKTVLKSQLVVAGFDSMGELSGANKVQIAKVIDDLYTSGDADADEATIGLVYQGSEITANVWAPTAQSVSLKVYDGAKASSASQAMVLDEVTGIWSYTGGSELDRMFYRFEVTVYHPVSGKVEVLEVTDPYSLSLSTNGEYSQFVNLSDEDLKPEGWDSHIIPSIANFEDAVLYEGHIRDFSALDESTSAANRGKYMAFTEVGSLPTEHLRKLAEHGVTHFHMLPANDIATIDEDEANTIDLNSTVAQLCALNADAMVCTEEDSNATLLSVFQSYDPASQPQKAQELTNDIRSYDRFNWGYDPHHFTAPEGSYASDPDGVARIKEMRAMNQALHEMGLRVVLDVVYNHTNASGLNDKSVLDKVVPGYYHRYDVSTGGIIRETCCDDTEPRNRMMEKLMHDSLLTWTSEYKFDSFRFDIMSQATKDTMVRLEEAVQAVDPDNYFYGEGWTRTDRSYEQANQPNMAGTEIGTFNDRIREAVRQGEIFSREESDSALAAQDRVKMSLAGTLTDFILNTSGGGDSETRNLGGYATDPADIINYVSKHDNETLWDQLNYVLPDDLTLTQRVRAQNVATTLPLMAQGIPFLQLGGDMLRSKSMDRNTYDSGDWFSYVDFTMSTNNWNMGLPLAQDNEAKWAEMSGFIYSPNRAAAMGEIEFASEVFNEFLAIRSSSSLFRLTTGEAIKQRVGFHNIGRRQIQGLIAMSIDDGINPDTETALADLDLMHDAVMVMVNSGYTTQSLTVNTATGFELHNIHAMSIDSVTQSATFVEGEDGNGTFTVPALTTAVFVKPQMGEQGYGLASFSTSGAPDVVPYGDTGVYLRGTIFDWANPAPDESAFTYTGDGIYTLRIDLEAGVEHNFKVAKGDWENADESLDLGAPADSSAVVALDTAYALNPNGGDNLVFTADTDTQYLFSLDASDVSAPILTIGYEEPYLGTTVYLRGSMNGWADPPTEPFAYDGLGIYSVTVDLAAEDYAFKIASADWATANFGSGEDDTDVLEAEPKPLGGGGDLTLSVESGFEAGRYTFLFDASNKSAAELTVTRLFGPTPVYLRGSMTDWGTSQQFVYDGTSNYATEIELSAGDYAFKVASEDWAAVNYGAISGDAADKAVVVGEDTTLGQADDNDLTLNITNDGIYKFAVNGTPNTAPTVTVSEVTP